MNSIENLILNTIEADSLAVAFDGFSKGHITSAMFEDDGIPLMKTNPRETIKWRKPLLYSSISQLIILSLAGKDKKGGSSQFTKILHRISKNNSVFLFRHADQGEKDLITLNPGQNMSARLLPLSIGLGITMNDFKMTFKQQWSYTLNISQNPQTIHAILILAQYINERFSLNDPGYSVTENLLNIHQNILKLYRENSPLLFDSGLNPDSFLDEISLYSDLFQASSTVTGELTEITRLLVKSLDKHSIHNITRLTINHPAAVLSASAAYIDYHSTGGWEVVKDIILEGGAASAGATVTAILLTMQNQNFTPRKDIQNRLINKNRITDLADKLNSGTCKEKDIEDFIDGEKSLTLKEQEEYHSKNKHKKKKSFVERKEKTTSREQELNRHVVESWTKLDKAKWRKKRDKFSPNDADNI